jgi:hypothetical protein
MQVVIEKIETLTELKDLLRDLRVENGLNDNDIADELERRKVEPRNWTAFRVRCLVKGLKVYRKWGRKTAEEEAARYGQKAVSNDTSQGEKRRGRSRRRVVVSKADFAAAEMLS